MWAWISTTFLWLCKAVGKLYVQRAYNILYSFPVTTRSVDWGSVASVSALLLI